jgi:hypothetical protein
MRIKRLWLVIIGLVLAQAAGALASQVVPMSLDQLADYSGQVIVGTVSSVESHWRENPRRIESEVNFDAVTVLKGGQTLQGGQNSKGTQALPNETFTLTVPGGTVGEFQMRVCCAPEFRPGDKWVLMLLPTYKTYPVVGIYRGALRVIADKDGVERVHDAAGRSVTGIDAQGHFVLDGETLRNVAQHLAGERGVHLRPSDVRETASKAAMGFQEFVDALTPVLAASRQHVLDQPAGVRVQADLRPVALKRSPITQAAGRGDDSAGRELPKPARADGDPRKGSAKEAAR